MITRQRKGKNMKDDVLELTIIIPSFNPDQKLIDVVDGLRERGFKDLVVINDGSDESHMWPFEKISEKSCVIHHSVNKGKGRALKTAFMFCIENRQRSQGIITVDGDNQHRPEDVYACGKELLENPYGLVLGCRDFSKNDVPARSKFGNEMTRSVFRLLCGLQVSDTQTGLRAIAMQYLPLMLRIDGERYEYETNMLLEMKNYELPIMEVPIETVYIDENESSHFNPIKDSIKIYKVIIKFFMNSIFSTMIDLAVFYLLCLLFQLNGWFPVVGIFIATATARIISSICNYKISRKMVFRSGGNGSFIKYYILCIGQMLVSASIVKGLAILFVSGSLLTTVLKAITDTCLFFISFRIQKNWVFKLEKKEVVRQEEQKVNQ